MFFDETNKQWFTESSDVLQFGENLRDELLSQGKETIPAGTVMVLAWLERPYMLFQTLQDLVLTSARNTTLLYYERGSIVFIGEGKEYVPTLRFRDCRFPTTLEYERYIRRATV